MKDCTKCPKRPQPGTFYKDSPCAKCKPFEPKNEKKTVQMTTGWWDIQTNEPRKEVVRRSL